MSPNKYNPKRDKNERPIIEALEKAGATVTQLSQTGVLDLLVGFRGVVRLLEVKDKGGSLTDAQIKFIEKWDGYPLFVVWNVDEALRAIGAIE
jgi:hypothetical protein